MISTAPASKRPVFTGTFSRPRFVLRQHFRQVKSRQVSGAVQYLATGYRGGENIALYPRTYVVLTPRSWYAQNRNLCQVRTLMQHTERDRRDPVATIT